jgi:hypothetical protein
MGGEKQWDDRSNGGEKDGRTQQLATLSLENCRTGEAMIATQVTGEAFRFDSTLPKAKSRWRLGSGRGGSGRGGARQGGGAGGRTSKEVGTVYAQGGGKIKKLKKGLGGFQTRRI